MKSSLMTLAGMNPIFIVLILVAFFGVIVLLIILLKRHVPGLKDDSKPKSEKEIAKEELDRVLVPIDEPKQEEKKEEAEAKEEKPSDDSTPKQGE